jgi:peptidoglycan hydrolase-like protein with peptidoglycan-binding domain
VKEIQQALGIQADGYFGGQTEQAVKAFQTAHALDADGIVGPRTRAKLAEKRAPTTAAPISAAAEQLVNMGFSDASVNARLLQKYNGDVEQVIAELLGA